MLSGLNHITLAVSDLNRSFQFYTDTLAFAPRAKWLQGAYLSLNDLWLCLSLDNAAPACDYTHFALTVELADIPQYRQKLSSAGAQFWKTNSSEGESLYFLDPDGHKLELHCGNLASRIESIRQQPYQGLQLFD